MVEILKITSITTAPRTIGNENVPRIFGVGENGYVYEWSHDENGWKPFTSKESN